jgi:hypothetical protein
MAWGNGKLSTPIPIGIDVNVLLSTILGGVITISGSLAVAAAYIGNQNKSAVKRSVHAIVQEEFFDKGLSLAGVATSSYGTATAFAIIDLRTWMLRCYVLKSVTEDRLKAVLENISKRPDVSDLLDRKLSLAIDSFPVLQKLGMPLAASVGKTLQMFSSMLGDLLNPDIILPQFKNNPSNIQKSFTSVGNFLGATQGFLSRKLIEIKDYFWCQDYETYLDFLKILQTDRYTRMMDIMEKYQIYVEKSADIFQSPDANERNKLLNEFGKWMDDNIKNNPLTDQSEEKTKETLSAEEKSP